MYLQLQHFSQFREVGSSRVAQWRKTLECQTQFWLQVWSAIRLRLSAAWIDVTRLPRVLKKSAIYCDSKPCNDLYVSRQIFNWMRAAIGSQCSLSRSNGVMWSLFWPRYRRRAAAFNTSWILWRWQFGNPNLLVVSPDSIKKQLKTLLFSQFWFPQYYMLRWIDLIHLTVGELNSGSETWIFVKMNFARSALLRFIYIERDAYKSIIINK